MFSIRNRFTNEPIYTSETATDLAGTVAEMLAKHKAWRQDPQTGARANLARADLTGADLADAYLARANLADAYLARANLSGADLTGANLTGADLTGADLTVADLSGANLTYAKLTRANLAGAYLAGAYLTGALNAPTGHHTDPVEPYVRRAPSPEILAERAQRYRERHPEVPVIVNLDAKILAAVTLGEGVLDMSQWHGAGGACGTTHCRAGWAIHLAGPAGAELERSHGSEVAGAMIYRASTGRVPHFFATNERALEDIKACAAANPIVEVAS